jgi:N-acetylglucosaminyl-diphospho-decaprenol L-rhamnosyltransferase
VLALNPDTLVRGAALRQLVAQMDADSRLGAATTTMIFPDGRVQPNGSRFPTYWFLVLNYTFIGKVLAGQKRALNDWLWYRDWDRRTPRDIDVLPGSCIIAPRALWQQIGGFHASMPMYFSDDYFSLMVQRAGLRTRYLCSDGIVHYEGMSAKQVSVWALRTYLHDLIAYTRLRFGVLAAGVLAVLLVPTWLVMWLKAR